jgi:hypothetical protein
MKLIKRLGLVFWLLFIIISADVRGQVTDSSRVVLEDTVVLPTVVSPDTTLRIKNLNPFFTLHVDSTLIYQFEINRESSDFFWYIRNSPVGLKINKDNGTLTFKADKSFFLSGKLKYDFEYKVNIGVQNQNNPAEKIDTFFTLVFYNTEIIPSRVKPSVSTVLYVEEGDTVNFKVQCESGSFPIENITFFSNIPLSASVMMILSGRRHSTL